MQREEQRLVFKLPPRLFSMLRFYCLLLFIVSSACFAQNDFSQKFEHYTVHYTVFSSTAISPDIAQRYGLVRSKERVLVNIAVVPNDRAFGGVAAKISGSGANLLQQVKNLDFIEINEPDAVYYLASFRHSNREVVHFTINVDPKDFDQPETIKFTKTLYVNP